MQPEGSLLYSQEPATCLYPEPNQSSLCSHPSSWKIHFNIILSTPRSSKWFLFPHVFPPEPSMHFPSPTIRAICPAYLILLILVPRIIFDEYRPLSSSLRSLFHSPFSYDAKQAAFVSQHDVNRLFFVINTKCVFWEEGNQFQYYVD